MLRTVKMMMASSRTMAPTDRTTYCSTDVERVPPRRSAAPPRARRSSCVRRSPGSSPCSVTVLLEDPEVAEDQPQDDEDQHRAEAPTAQLLRTVTGREAAQQLAHGHSGGLSGTQECSIRTGRDG